MTAEERRAAVEHLVRRMFVAENQTANLDTSEILSMVGRLDDFVEANMTAINNAIPAGVRAKASLNQKALALAYVCMKRGGVI